MCATLSLHHIFVVESWCICENVLTKLSKKSIKFAFVKVTVDVVKWNGVLSLAYFSVLMRGEYFSRSTSLSDGTVTTSVYFLTLCSKAQIKNKKVSVSRFVNVLFKKKNVKSNKISLFIKFCSWWWWWFFFSLFPFFCYFIYVLVCFIKLKIIFLYFQFFLSRVHFSFSLFSFYCFVRNVFLKIFLCFFFVLIQFKYLFRLVLNN